MVAHQCRRGRSVGHWRPRARPSALARTADTSASASASASAPADGLVTTLWLVRSDAGAPIVGGADGTRSRVAYRVPAGEVVEAWPVREGSADGTAWARLTPSEARRLLRDGAADGADYFLRVDQPDVWAPFGGRVGGERDAELWFERSHFADVLGQKPPPRAPRSPIGAHKRLRTMGGRRVDDTPPLRALDARVTDDVVERLVERGYVVVDDALPSSLCQKLRREMEALESNGQMWNSQSYGGGGGGSPHLHINETQLDYKEVRRYAPTFARMEHDPSLIELVRGVPGLHDLYFQHVRIQINQGRGGCYTMHTDSGSRAESDGQTLSLTALFYLNEKWKPGDGGELRVFPYPHAAEVIPPVQGRMVLFEPRMVHDVLPSHRKRFCFTLWCTRKAYAQTRQVDHATMSTMEMQPDLGEAARLGGEWRRKHGHAVYGGGLPAPLRPLFSPEMRMSLVRCTHRDDELSQIAISHPAGAELDAMIEGCAAHHARVRESNPAWALELFGQLPLAAAASCESRGAGTGDAAALRLGELRELAHRLGPWWI